VKTHLNRFDIVLIRFKGVTHTQTDRETPRLWLKRAKHYMLSRVTKAKNSCFEQPVILEVVWRLHVKSLKLSSELFFFSERLLCPARYGNQGQSGENLNDTVTLAIPRKPYPRTKITTLFYTQLRLWSFKELLIFRISAIVFFGIFWINTQILISRHKILSRNTRDSVLLYGENPKSLSHLGLQRYWDVTDRHQVGHQDRH